MFEIIKFRWRGLFSKGQYYIAIALPVIGLLVHYLYPQFSKDLGGLGTYLIGFASWYLGNFARSEVTKLKQKKRIETASAIFILFETCIENVLEVMDNPKLYEYDDHYPWSVPEKKNSGNNVSVFPERPARLIYNWIGDLKKKTNEGISCFSHAEFWKLKKLFVQVQELTWIISQRLNGDIKEHPEESMHFKSTISDVEIKAELQRVLEEVKKLFDSIIHSTQ